MKKKENFGITLIALVITIIVLLILAGIAIAMLTGDNNLINNAQKAAILTEVEGLRETIELKTIDDDEKVSGKLSEIENLNISQDLINKYDNILYVKDNKLYLDFIAGFPKTQEYINNKNKIEILKNNMEICYDRLKTYNKILNSSFDDGFNNYTQRTTSGNTTTILNEDGNNYLHIEMHVSSGNTQYILQICDSASDYGEKIYVSIKYRNQYVESEENHKINNPAWVSRGGNGYDTPLLSKAEYIKSYNQGWKNISMVRTILKNYGTLKTQIHMGGDAGNKTTCEYTIDFDDLYIINLTQIFGEGNEPTKQEMDNIFNNF